MDELACGLGISVVIVKQWLRNRMLPTFHILQKFKDAFDVDMNEFFED